MLRDTTQAGKNVMPQAMSDSEVQQALGRLDGWAYEGGKLTKTFQFGSFKEAMSFLVRISFEAEAQEHHPEIHNVYNRVALSLATHDAGGRVTEKDVALAKAIEDVNWTMS